MQKILIVYYSVHGGTQQLAHALAEGVLDTGGDVMLRTVPRVAPIGSKAQEEDLISTNDVPYVSKEDLQDCDGLIIGSPTRFGNMAASLKYFIDTLSQQWINNELVGKPAGAFCSSASLHGGQEATPLSMMIPLMHLGMVIVSLPYRYHDLAHTISGGTPYGPSHWSENNKREKLSDQERQLCLDYAQHFVEIATKLA